MSDDEVEGDWDADYEVDNPEATKDISLNQSEVTNSSVNDESFDLDTSTFSVDDPGLTSTPTKAKPTRSKGKGKGKGLEFKVPKPPPQVFGRCPECKRGLKTFGGLKNHILAHKWKDLATRTPNTEELMEYCTQQCQSNILQKIAADRAGGKGGPCFNSFVEQLTSKTDSTEWIQFSKLVCELILSTFQEKPATKGSKQPSGRAFASGLRSQVQRHVTKILSCKESRGDLIESLFKVEVAPTQVAYPFLMSFMLKVGNSALVFTFRSMTGRLYSEDPERRSQSKDDFLSLKAQKVLHYISGSCVRSHFRHACRHPRNNKLQHIKNLIVTRFVQTPPTVAEKKDRAYWTHTMNRKSLFFVNDNAFNFFLELAKLLQSMECKEGSLGHEAVMDRVVDLPEILFKWDMIVGSTLSEEDSFSFMVKIVRSLTNTYGVGVLNRRMNQMWKKGKGNKGSISVSHRARVL